MLSFDLDCGRSVYLDSLHYSRTYAGLLEGRPNAQYNTEITTRVCTNTNSPAHLVPPDLDNTDPEHPSLPPIEMIAKVWCNDPITPNGMGSHATIIWYRDTWDSQSLTDVVLDGIRGVDWNKIAADFDW